MHGLSAHLLNMLKTLEIDVADGAFHLIMLQITQTSS